MVRPYPYFLGGYWKSMRPRGLCWCGCGQVTSLATLTNRKRGDIQGFPVKYLYGHRLKIHRRGFNDFEIRGDLAIVFLDRRDGSRLEAEIDRVDLEKVLGHYCKWCPIWSRAANTFYAQAYRGKESPRTVLLHRYILDAPIDMEVDHWDHNGLNCRRSNIRVVDQSTNMLNARSPIGKSGYRGVSKQGRKYAAMVTYQKKHIRLGTFETPYEASLVVKAKWREILGREPDR